MFVDGLDDFPLANAKRSTGRSAGMSDLELHTSRDVLVGLLENTWSEVGLSLRNLDNAADIANALHPWESNRTLHEGVRALLRPVNIGPPEQSLSVARKHYLTAVDAFLNTEESRRQYANLNEKANWALLAPASRAKKQKKKIRKVKIAVKIQLDKTGTEYAASNKKLNERKEVLADAYARFAQAELVRFCQSARYRLTPLNIANALAGLPKIGFRQAVKKTVKWKCTVAGGGNYQLFLTIRKMLDSWDWGTDLSAHIERKLNGKGKSVSRPIVELREYWPQLSLAIDSIPKDCSLVEMPFKITRGYFEKKYRLSQTDELLIAARRVGMIN